MSTETYQPRFCGYLVPWCQPGNGLPAVILTREGDHAEHKSRDGDHWWSVRDDFDAPPGTEWRTSGGSRKSSRSGFRTILRLRDYQIESVAKLLSALTFPSGPDAIKRDAIIARVRGEAIGKGCDPGRLDRATAMLGDGGLTRASILYGSNANGCTCPDYERGRRGCKHQVAAAMAQALRYDPAIVADVAVWTGQLEMPAIEPAAVAVADWPLVEPVPW